MGLGMKCDNFAAIAKERVTIQTRVEAADAFGGQNVTWSNLGTYWAFVKPIGGRELFAADKLDSRVTHKILIRHLSVLKDTDLASKYRISFDNQIFTIDYVENLSKDLQAYGKDFQRLHCIANGAENV